MKGISTENLSIGYDRVLISGIRINIEYGKIMSVIGPNGCGKSTLLKTITGQLDKKAGVVFLDGRDSLEFSATERAQKMAMVSTERIRTGFMTCREVVEAGRYPYTGALGLLGDDDRQIAEEAMKSLGVFDLAASDFARISDGQRQRVMLARAICQKPRILILDEPTSFLDIRHRLDILLRIRDLAREENMAIIMSLHELECAMRISDVVMAMGDGKVQRIGSPEEVFEEGFIRELYDIKGADLYLTGSNPWMRSKYKSEIGYDKEDRSISKSENGHKCAGIMIQGTMSNVGKSVIAAGLCRVFTRAGFRVAPFKSQNMALNSYVTDDGKEMGRAQVMQAECCGRKPTASMNPILLKPNSNTGSQIIVNGEPVGNMAAKDYFSYKTKLIPDIMKAFHELEQDSDIIVIEGAGSPAEINLRENDIVNMGLADMLDAPVLLVGDIDPGGVFAQLLGTLSLLSDSERNRVKGLIINRFRGDKSLLDPGIESLEELGGKKVLGVVPYLDIALDDEDSLSSRFSKKEAAYIDIAVLKLPHISNFTDMNIFETHSDVSVRYITDPRELSGADAIIIPGSKSTISDLNWLKEKDLFDAVREAGLSGKIVLGICGGYQMLGRCITDPYCTEGEREAQGLGLLPVDTVMGTEKKRSLFKGAVAEPEGALAALKGIPAEGYEIHIGNTTPAENAEELREFTSEGTGFCLGNIYGTYVHGLFDTGDIASAFVKAVAEHNNKTLDKISFPDYADFKQLQYDRLADELEKHLDMEEIYRIIGVSK